MALKDLNEIYLKIQSAFHEIRQIPDIVLPDAFKNEYEKFVLSNQPDGYVSVHWNLHTAVITTNTGRKIFLPNQWFIISTLLHEYLFSLLEYKDLFDQILTNVPDIKTKLQSIKEQRVVSTDITRYLEKYKWNTKVDRQLFERFLTDYDWWGGGKTIDRGDFFVSPVMKLGNLLQETQTGIAEITRHFYQHKSLVNYLNQIASKIMINDSYLSEIKGEKKLESKNYTLAILPKPFLLLAGISGTGKTRFIREQAKMAAKQAEIDLAVNYCCVAVRPDWHEPSDLLGYVSRIGGKADYVPTQFLSFLIDAWKHATDDNGDFLPFENQIPFWLCLDEMNLAPVEQYFADFLSALESRKWEDGEYKCEALLNKVSFENVDSNDLKKKLKLDANSKTEKLWEIFKEKGITIPPNLIVAGTVNMDETTHGFSRKVIDRALTFDFGEFFPNSYSDYFLPKDIIKQFGISCLTHITGNNRELLRDVTADPDGEKTIEFLKGLNIILEGTPFELAYRALNELLLALVCFKPQNEIELCAVWDDFLMMKVLPRIDGDSDKLSYVHNKTVDDKIQKELAVEQDGLNLLVYIYEYFSNNLREIWGDDKTRPDLFRTDVADSSKPVQIPCRSRKKILWMFKRLKTNGFTSFWP